MVFIHGLGSSAQLSSTALFLSFPHPLHFDQFCDILKKVKELYEWQCQYSFCLRPLRYSEVAWLVGLNNACLLSMTDLCNVQICLIKTKKFHKHSFWGYDDEVKHEFCMKQENLCNFRLLQNVKFFVFCYILQLNARILRSFLDQSMFKIPLTKRLND